MQASHHEPAHDQHKSSTSSTHTTPVASMPPRRRRNDQCRSQISDILNPVTGGVRELMLRCACPTEIAVRIACTFGAICEAWVLTGRLRPSRQGLTPVDHAKNNIAAVRAMSKATKDRRLRGGNAQPMQSSASPSAS